MTKILTFEILKSLIAYDPLTGNFERKNSQYMSGRANSRNAGKPVGNLRPDGYLAICLLGKRYLAHRVAWFYVTGEWPPNFLDHINGDPSDNRFSNLRECTQSQNVCNRGKGKNNTTGLKGIWIEKRSKKNPWCASISLNGKTKHLGSFATREKAYRAYLSASLESRGEFFAP